MFDTEFFIGAGLVFGFGVFALVVAIPMAFRRVVSTNEVHIVQSSRATRSYGKDTAFGNVYYQWPSWVPFFGVSKIKLPVSNFDVDLENYEAYDKGRLPFSVDVKAFFRVADSNLAAQRVASFEELQNQLEAIVQGAIRTVLASSDIEEIMQGRSKFGDEFTREVNEQLANWGVMTVKNIELMDLRDGTNGHAIKNIMEKKKSHIEMESRIAVAANNRTAQISEIEAKREVDLQTQHAQQVVGLRTVENQREVALANEQSAQAVKEQNRATVEKDMAVKRMAQVKQAEIDQEVSRIGAEQDKIVVVLNAEGKLEAATREAKAVEIAGQAKAEAEKAMQLAPVQAQITLAKEIGANESYQKYLVTIRQVEANQTVGVAQAQALTKADVKIIANTGTPTAGVTKVMDLFSTQGGTQLAGMVEAFSQSPTGAKVMKTLGVSSEDTTENLQ